MTQLTEEEANKLSGCGYGCYVIGGMWIAENPSCPEHGKLAKFSRLYKIGHNDGFEAGLQAASAFVMSRKASCSEFWAKKISELQPPKEMEIE